MRNILIFAAIVLLMAGCDTETDPPTVHATPPPPVPDWLMAQDSVWDDGGLTVAHYADNLFLAAGYRQRHDEDSGYLATSADGLAWTTTRLPLADRPTDIGHNDTLLLVSSFLKGMVSSRDGLTWTVIPGSPSLYSLVWADTMFVGITALGEHIFTSPNAIDWSWLHIGSAEGLQDIAWSGERFVVVQNWHEPVFYSTNGLDWSIGHPGHDEGFLAVCWGNGMFVAVGRHGALATSPDGITWTFRSSGVVLDHLYEVAWTGTRFVATGGRDESDPGVVVISADGLAWYPEDIDVTGGLGGVASSGDRDVVVGMWGQILATP